MLYIVSCNQGFYLSVRVGGGFFKGRRWVQNTYPLGEFGCMLTWEKFGKGNATKWVLKAFWQGNIASHERTRVNFWSSMQNFPGSRFLVQPWYLYL